MKKQHSFNLQIHFIHYSVSASRTFETKTNKHAENLALRWAYNCLEDCERDGLGNKFISYKLRRIN